MMRRATLWLTAAGLGLLAGCNQGPAGPGSGSGAAADAGVVEFVTASGVPMVYLPGGRFTMGSSDGNADEAPPHEVTISPLAIDKTPVTQQMFADAQLPNPSHWQGPRLPIERVRWRDAQRYCNERSLLENLQPCYNEKTPDWDCDFSANGYRLPTEAEWEYAARAGTTTPYECGTADKLRQYAWFAENAEQRTHPVGQKKPNRWGLCDLCGNVAEWCQDVYSPTYYQQSPPADPPGPPAMGRDTKRVLRGGGWKASAELCRVSCRQGESTGNADACFATDYCGLRCVRRISTEELDRLRQATAAGK